MKALSSLRASSKRRKIVITSVVAAIVLASGVGATVYFSNKQRESADIAQRDSSNVKEDQVKKASNDAPKSQLPSKNSEDSTQSSQDNQSTESPATPPEKPSIERASGDPTVKVVATFQHASSGYCELTFSKSGQQTVSYKSDIVVSTSYYTCSFSVSRSSLPVNGPWNMIVTHHIGSSATPSDTVELQ